MNDISQIMQTVDWSRAQFAMTAIYHWLFVPLTLGLSIIVAMFETAWYRTRDDFWRRTTRFWMRLFGINFAIGIATGLILEFEFGTNWSNYSHFVGDIFGAPLAAEGIFAFFLESTFVVIMFFGWNKVSHGFHLTATWLTALGASLSALWILVANAWMQYPVGMDFNLETARMEMTSFWDVLLSPVAINKFFHTVLSGFVLSAAFVAGVSAWYLLKGREQRMARQSIRFASVFGLASIVLCIFTGDGSGVRIARTQPMKLAAMEAHWDGGRSAPLVAFGLLSPWENVTGHEDAFRFKFEVPGLLSVMSFHDATAYVPGINDLLYGNPEEGILSVEEKMVRGREAIAMLARYRDARNAGDREAMAATAAYFDRSTPQGQKFLDENFRWFGYGYLPDARAAVPNVPLVFYSFRVMVGLGVFFLILFALTIGSLRGQRLERARWLQYVLLWSIPLAWLCTVAGWIVTEVGRQPWTVQDLLPTWASVSHLNAGSVSLTFVLFAALFTTLLIAEIMIMTRQIKIGPKNE